ncbi:winged helix-turn-helix domain-containing tetratricopeptide repeat protein [Yoonia sediminilitoris]|uniref:TolB-like protein n=1 Tax=Yoonia sediminilitoris TaxID=1286148 RepID=A0A2T6K113_9RHOB|nr:winged helix-turn-helix domain-containing protein [Yoonia sediminilitoris]PUB08315.1 TolB-like protein [Yoonia sediminilitoris]RCW89419.1 TolB-like protein [Yoonia sediminilitoris]
MKNYEFAKNGLVLDGADGSLTTRSGDPVELRPQTREVLKFLAEHPEKTLTKADFAEAVWEGRQVSEDSLVQCIAEIRNAIGDADRRIIETVPRKGYRFAPPQPATTGHAKRTTLLAVVLVALVGVVGFFLWRSDGQTHPPVVAVLPFDDLSAEPDRGYLQDALSEGVITELARFPQFRVVARNSSFQFRDKPTDIREIGRILGAGYVVEGSQQLDGTRLRVTVQLIETESGVHVFAKRYDRNIHDLFSVQDEIVRQVSSVVGQTVLSEMPRRTSARDVDSRLRGLQARNIMSQLSYENWQKAMALEETSIREEPDSAWGYIGKSLMLGAAAALGWMEPRDEVLDEAVDLANTAMRLDPENYMSHFTLARILTRKENFAESILHYQRSAELNPSDSLILIGSSIPLLYLGRTDEAINSLNRAKEVDPLHGDWLRWQLGKAYWQNNECDRALEAMQSMASPVAAASMTVALIHICLDQPELARSAMNVFLESRPTHTLEAEAAKTPKNWKPDGMVERYLQGLKQAGLN